jgi:hypothetical protein
MNRRGVPGERGVYPRPRPEARERSRDPRRARWETRTETRRVVCRDFTGQDDAHQRLQSKITYLQCKQGDAVT